MVFKGVESGIDHEENLVFSKFYSQSPTPKNKVYYSEKTEYYSTAFKITPSCTVSRIFEVPGFSMFAFCRVEGQQCVLLASGSYSLELYRLADCPLVYQRVFPGIKTINSFADDYALLMTRELKLLLVHLKKFEFCSEIDLMPDPEPGYKGKFYPNILLMKTSNFVTNTNSGKVLKVSEQQIGRADH